MNSTAKDRPVGLMVLNVFLAATLAAPAPRAVLFVCSGNFYRSRFAEAVFNHEAKKAGLTWRARSRGVRRGPLKADQQRRKLSPHARAKLIELGVPLDETAPEPVKATIEDFKTADRIVAMNGREHRPLIESQYGRNFEVTYWDFVDVEEAAPDTVLPALAARVRGLVRSLR